MSKKRKKLIPRKFLQGGVLYAPEEVRRDWDARLVPFSSLSPLAELRTDLGPYQDLGTASLIVDPNTRQRYLKYINPTAVGKDKRKHKYPYVSSMDDLVGKALKSLKDYAVKVGTDWLEGYKKSTGNGFSPIASSAYGALKTVGDNVVFPFMENVVTPIWNGMFRVMATDPSDPMGTRTGITPEIRNQAADKVATAVGSSMMPSRVIGSARSAFMDRGFQLPWSLNNPGLTDDPYLDTTFDLATLHAVNTPAGKAVIKNTGKAVADAARKVADTARNYDIVMRNVGNNAYTSFIPVPSLIPTIVRRLVRRSNVLHNTPYNEEAIVVPVQKIIDTLRRLNTEFTAELIEEYLGRQGLTMDQLRLPNGSERPILIGSRDQFVNVINDVAGEMGISPQEVLDAVYFRRSNPRHQQIRNNLEMHINRDTQNIRLLRLNLEQVDRSGERLEAPSESISSVGEVPITSSKKSYIAPEIGKPSPNGVMRLADNVGDSRIALVGTQGRKVMPARVAEQISGLGKRYRDALIDDGVYVEGAKDFYTYEELAKNPSKFRMSSRSSSSGYNVGDYNFLNLPGNIHGDIAPLTIVAHEFKFKPGSRDFGEKRVYVDQFGERLYNNKLIDTQTGLRGDLPTTEIEIVPSYKLNYGSTILLDENGFPILPDEHGFLPSYNGTPMQSGRVFVKDENGNILVGEDGKPVTRRIDASEVVDIAGEGSGIFHDSRGAYSADSNLINLNAHITMRQSDLDLKSVKTGYMPDDRYSTHSYWGTDDAGKRNIQEFRERVMNDPELMDFYLNNQNNWKVNTTRELDSWGGWNEFSNPREGYIEYQKYRRNPNTGKLEGTGEWERIADYHPLTEAERVRIYNERINTPAMIRRIRRSGLTPEDFYAKLFDDNYYGKYVTPEGEIFNRNGVSEGIPNNIVKLEDGRIYIPNDHAPMIYDNAGNRIGYGEIIYDPKSSRMYFPTHNIYKKQGGKFRKGGNIWKTLKTKLFLNKINNLNIS